MIYITYDISNNKVRTQFHKFLRKHGRPIQLSVFELKNSDRILNVVMLQIKKVFLPKFTNADSILVIPICQSDQKKIIRMGSAVQEEKEIIWLE